MLHIGQRGYVSTDTFLMILPFHYTCSRNTYKFYKKRAQEDKVFSAKTKGKRQSLILTTSGRLLISAIIPETILKRALQEGLQMLNVGHGFYINVNEIDFILPFNIKSNSFYINAIKEKRLDDELIDTTAGKTPRSIIVTKSGEGVLSSITPQTLVRRLKNGGVSGQAKDQVQKIN